MLHMSTQTLQIKLALDEGLKKTWSYLQSQYEALDKASIIRLAINTLARQEKQKMENPDALIDDVLNYIENRKDGMTEDEFRKWWAVHKKGLRGY